MCLSYKSVKITGVHKILLRSIQIGVIECYQNLVRQSNILFECAVKPLGELVQPFMNVSMSDGWAKVKCDGQVTI
jgi:hypothetical protein